MVDDIFEVDIPRVFQRILLVEFKRDNYWIVFLIMLSVIPLLLYFLLKKKKKFTVDYLHYLSEQIVSCLFMFIFLEQSIMHTSNVLIELISVLP